MTTPATDAPPIATSSQASLTVLTWHDPAGATLPWHTRVWEALRRAGLPLAHHPIEHPPFALYPQDAAHVRIVTWNSDVAQALAKQPGVSQDTTIFPVVPSAPGPARIAVETLTPLLFRRGGQTIPYPTPAFVAQSLQRLADLFVLPVTVPVLTPTTLNGGVMQIPLPTGSGTLPGFVGSWTYDLSQAPAALRQAAGAAWAVAAYTGLGAKTGIGFGQVAVTLA